MEESKEECLGDRYDANVTTEESMKEQISEVTIKDPFVLLHDAKSEQVTPQQNEILVAMMQSMMAQLQQDARNIEEMKTTLLDSDKRNMEEMKTMLLESSQRLEATMYHQREQAEKSLNKSRQDEITDEEDHLEIIEEKKKPLSELRLDEIGNNIIPEQFEQKIESECVEEMPQVDIEKELSVIIGKDMLVDEDVKAKGGSDNTVELDQDEGTFSQNNIEPLSPILLEELIISTNIQPMPSVEEKVPIDDEDKVIDEKSKMNISVTVEEKSENVMEEVEQKVEIEQNESKIDVTGAKIEEDEETESDIENMEIRESTSPIEREDEEEEFELLKLKGVNDLTRPDLKEKEFGFTYERSKEENLEQDQLLNQNLFVEETSQFPTRDSSNQLQIEYPMMDAEIESVKNEEIKIMENVNEIVNPPSEKLLTVGEEIFEITNQEAVHREESETKIVSSAEIESVGITEGRKKLLSKMITGVKYIMTREQGKGKNRHWKKRAKVHRKSKYGRCGVNAIIPDDYEPNKGIFNVRSLKPCYDIPPDPGKL